MAEYLSSFLPDGSAGSTKEGVSRTLTSRSQHPYREIHGNDITAMLRPRLKFSHKGTFGHALIIAGERETMGAALLAAKGCLHAGAGLTTMCIPESALTALNCSLPEVMYLSREKIFDNGEIDKYNAVAIGPGIGVDGNAGALLSYLLELKRPIIADADALNLMASNSLLLQGISKDSILTPHMKEFDRLFGAHETWYERLQTARQKARELGVVIVLKNRYTFVIDQEGLVCINTTGSPAMAQGGMGDVLTGIIAAYVAAGYSSKEAAILGCYMHGEAGWELGEEKFHVTASELASHLPRILKKHGYYKME